MEELAEDLIATDAKFKKLLSIGKESYVESAYISVENDFQKEVDLIDNKIKFLRSLNIKDLDEKMLRNAHADRLADLEIDRLLLEERIKNWKQAVGTEYERALKFLQEDIKYLQSKLESSKN